MIPSETYIDQLSEEQQRLASLLKDKNFAHHIARNLDAAYYLEAGENPPAFLSEKEQTQAVDKKVKEEKIAMNLAGFYALECGIGALCERDGEMPKDWLRRIVAGELDVQDVMLLNHFANATWKAGQPFRALDRITRPVFTVFSLLPQEEKDKDFVQIQTAARKLIESFEEEDVSDLEKQWKQLKSLIRNEAYALEMAAFLDASYYTGQNQEAPPFISTEEENRVISKSVKEEKIAINLAGFYALESGVDYLAGIQQKLPSEILRSISEDTVNHRDKQLLCRFANATWKSGQPFRSLSRITRDVFVPFDLLSDQDKEKDWVQVKTAARLVLETIG
jgi:hypothetical protein